MDKRIDEVWQQYMTLKKKHMKKDLQRNRLSSLGVTLELNPHTEYLKTALIQLSSLIRNETKKYAGIELAALELYSTILNIVEKKEYIVSPVDDPRYLSPDYIKFRTDDLRLKIKEEELLAEKLKEKEQPILPQSDNENNHPTDSPASSSPSQ
ncbi:hypothetical protein KY332_02930 [Candidatus Woesearchaeota archaeon]|nr:hypothetical protein [Candidatus Woesearchaeota archaeon]